MAFDPLQTVFGAEERLSVSEVEAQRVPFLQSEQLESKPPATKDKTIIRNLAHLCFAAAIILFFGELWHQPSDAQCIRKLNAWSPVLDAIKYEEEVQPAPSESPFIGKPSDDMEAAWDELWKFGSMGLPESQLPLLNKSVTDYDWHRLHPETGGGIQAYIEGFHYIHCLNLVRQYIYRDQRDYSYLFFFTNENIDVLEHTEHCIEMLRVKVMCESDTAMYPVSTLEDGSLLLNMPEDQRCRDFEAVTSWANEHITVTVDH